MNFNTILLIILNLFLFYVLTRICKKTKTKSKFNQTSDQTLIFFAPWCGHCKTFKPEFETAMGELDGKKATKDKIKGKTVRFAKIDCDKEENKPLAKKYNIGGYPTVKIISDNGAAIEYDGERSSDGMRKYLTVDN